MTTSPEAPSTSAVDAVPAALVDYARSRFAAAGLPAGAVEAATQQLARLAAARSSGNEPIQKWFHEQARLGADYLQQDPSAAAALERGEMDIEALLRLRQERAAAAGGLFRVINGRHRELRQAFGSGREGVDVRQGAEQVEDTVGDASGVTAAAAAAPGGWAEAADDEDANRRYAEAASQIGVRPWVQEGIEWCSEQCRRFFHGGGALTLARKEAARRSWQARGAPLSEAETEAVVAALRANADVVRPAERPVRLLDVGSCGSMFDGQRDISCDACDLCPSSGHPTTMQCDFLRLEIGDAASARVVAPSADFPGGLLRKLPAASYDAIVFSLVLSYLPLAKQRGAMIARARRLLPTPAAAPTAAQGVEGNGEEAGGGGGGAASVGGGDGDGGGGGSERRGLLLLVETFGVDRRATSWPAQTYLHAWVAKVEALGFRFLRHQTLQRSHALAFVTRPLDAAEERRGGLEHLLREEALPELVMRREAREEGWDVERAKT